MDYTEDGPVPWTSVYIKLLVAFRRQALRELKGAPLSVFICLALHVGDAGYADPSLETIMRETGYGRATVCSALVVLYDLGLVEKVKRWKRSNKYFVRGYAWFGQAKQPALFETWSSESELYAHGSSESELQEGSGVQNLNGKIIDDDDLDPIIINKDLCVQKTELQTGDGVQKVNSITLQTLYQYGVGEPTASELALLAHVTPGFIRAWFSERDYHNDMVQDGRRGGRQWGVGYLIQQMRANVPPARLDPADYEYEQHEQEVAK